MIAGRWFITPHAVRQYIARVRPGLDYEAALGEIIDLSQAAHLVFREAGGVERWRGPFPERLRLIVAPPRQAGEAPALVTVETGWDGARLPAPLVRP